MCGRCRRVVRARGTNCSAANRRPGRSEHRPSVLIKPAKGNRVADTAVAFNAGDDDAGERLVYAYFHYLQNGGASSRLESGTPLGGIIPSKSSDHRRSENRMSKLRR